MKPSVILGPPGTGKTTKLISMLQELMLTVPISQIGFVSFSKAAAEEAKKRTSEKLGVNVKSLDNFRTIHSVCFKACGVSRNEVITRDNLIAFGQVIGLDIKGTTAVDDDFLVNNSDDRYLFIESQARLRCISLEEAFNQLADTDISFQKLQFVSDCYAKYKEKNLLVDYTDMLELALSRGFFPELDTLYVDEAQDLSRLQWKVIFHWAKKIKRVIIAGDDDQAIHTWAGADVETFLRLIKSSDDLSVLNTTYRLPSAIHEYSRELIQRIDVEQRYEKQFKSLDKEGQVKHLGDFYKVDLSQGTWLLLARNNFLLNQFKKHCQDLGYSYEYRGQKPIDSPNLQAVVAFEKLKKNKPVSVNEAKLILFKAFSNGKLSKNVQVTDGYVNNEQFVREYNIDLTKSWFAFLRYIPHDVKQYYITARRKGESLAVGSPRIRIMTIHSAKGTEADNVVLLSDISARVESNVYTNKNDEVRVFYVGATRAKNNLFIIYPQSKYSFKL